ncbi:MAG: hypothetical protein M3237_03320 [Actinomycetota bacterium]|nr:hypothetical protein [Actinomycetota bacterium]
MRRRLTAVSAAMLLAVTACSDGDEPTAAARPTELSVLEDDPAAATAVSAALDRLRESDTGTFTTGLVYDDVTFDYYGSYRLSPAQQRVSVTAGLPDDPVTTEAVGDSGPFYVRLPPDGPVSSLCWVSGDPQQIAEVTGVETNPDFNRLPGALSIASTAVGVAYAEDSPRGEVLGSVDLATATALISQRLPALLGLVGASHRVLARFTLHDGVLAAIRVEGPAILAALDRAGTEAEPDELAEVFGADVPIEVTLADAGEKVVIAPPAPAAVIDLGDPDAAQRLTECDD